MIIQRFDVKQIAFFIFLLSIFCSETEAIEGNGIVKNTDFNILGISIGDTYETVIKTLGKPKKEERSASKFAESQPIHLYYSGIYIFISDGEIVKIKISKPGYLRMIKIFDGEAA